MSAAPHWELVPQVNSLWMVRDRGTGTIVGHFMPQEAALIAAAPKLLAAVAALLRAPSIGSDGTGSSTLVVQEFNLRAAREAYAEATGGAA